MSNLAELKDFIDSLGESIQKSGIFGCQNHHQGKVFALEAMTGTMLRMANQYHVFPSGRLTRKADDMLAGFNECGGEYRILQRDENAVSISMTIGDQTVEFGLTWDDAQKEPFVYQGKESDIIAKLAKGEIPPLKPKYATPHSRMQMLWARLVSDAVRAIAPQVAAGRYTPEEMEDFLPWVKLAEGLVGVPLAKRPVMVAPAVPTDAAYTLSTPAFNVEDYKIPVVNEVPVEKVVETATQEIEIIASERTIEILRGLLHKLNAPKPAVDAAIKRRGVERIEELSEPVAREWIEELRSRLVQESEKVKESPSLGAVSESLDDPCSEVQIAEIRRTMEHLSQEGGVEICEKVKNRLKSQGLRLADLSIREARELKKALDMKEIEQWATNQLSGVASKKAS